MRSLSRSSSLALFALLGLGACSANVAPSGADADTSSTHALLVVEQSASVDEDEASRSHASVFFLRVSEEQSVQAATQLVTDELELPEPGQCVVLGADRGQDPAPAAFDPIELAFAGEVSVEAARSRVPLAVHAFPDVADLVSGVVYTARGQADLDLPEDGILGIHASGTGDFPAFEAFAEAPIVPRQVQLDGIPMGMPSFEAHQNRPMQVTWTAGDGSDQVYIDVDPVPGAPAERVRCALSDTGTGTVPAMAIPETSMMGVAFHRVRDVPLRSDGDVVGTAHFDLGITARVRIASP